MKKIPFTLLMIFMSVHCLGQAKLVNVKSRKFKTSSNLKVHGYSGYLEVPENRNHASSRSIRLKYVHLKSLSENPAAPVVYLEGGSGISTWEASSPRDLTDRIALLKVADLIYLDRRGASDESLTYTWKDAFPDDFFVSEEKANQHYQKMAKEALASFQKNDIDIAGYNIEAHAKDVDDLMRAIGFDRYTIFGFSYGSHIGMTVLNLFPEHVERAIFVGEDAPNQAFNFPSHLDKQIGKIGDLVAQDSTLNMTAADFKDLVDQAIKKLEANPVSVIVKNPLTKRDISLNIGGFGLAFILRLDIDDTNDIPVIPRLLYSIKQGDHRMLTWFAQRRMTFALGLPGQGINQQLASGASPSRWSTIERESKESIFGNVVNFPFSALKDHWVSQTLSFDPSVPLQSEIPTLFITGTLDARTPIEQVETTMKGFVNATHIKVENAGHEQAQWDAEVADQIIPRFIRGADIRSTSVFYSDIKFVRLTGKATGHPSLP